MKKLSLLALISLIISCTPKTVTTIPEAQFEQLDTLVITAPKKDNEIVGFNLKKYNPSAKRVNDLIHTKLDIKFDWEKEQVLGKAELTLTPVFHPVTSVTLDAKGFEFSKVKMKGGKDLTFTYDGKQIKIDLDAMYKRGAEYTIETEYIASPRADGGSAAISSDKGLFFINPRGEEGDKPQQIWTQGETEHNSRWFPTIDKPNERCTQELSVTVQDKYETLSNGILVESKDNKDGTRTDYWKMDKPHAPYLFALVVGDFAVVEDKWKGIDVDYYVEPEYEDHARAIFPYTPEMLTFFSDVLDFQYPWQKYSQVVVRDYVSGAMENTTAVIFGEFMQGTDRDLLDVLTNEKIVAHEMMHHWFGDYVTCESWSNLTLNEGFANYSEYLWLEHKHGRDEADAHWLEEFEGYLGQARGQGIHPLIHYGYDDKEEMFDAHSYNKGGMVLHMLRNYLGDDAFFAGLKKYLRDNALTAVEVDELRMAFEDTVGEDLNWFFNQWFLQQGHPNLEFSKFYNAETGNLELTILQTQDAERMPAIFELPIEVDIYYSAVDKVRENLRVTKREETFIIPVKSEPVFTDIDPNKVLLAEKTEDKNHPELIFQYYNTKSFANRLESLRGLAESINPDAPGVYQSALQDDFWIVRLIAVNALGVNDDTAEIIAALAKNDPHSQVRATAVTQLGQSADKSYLNILNNRLKDDPSYTVQGAALVALTQIDSEAALAAAENLENTDNDDLLAAVAAIYVESGDAKYLPFFEKGLEGVDGFGAISFFESYGQLAAKGDKQTLIDGALKLNKIGGNESTSPFRRFAAVKTLNDLYLAAYDRSQSAEDDKVKEEMSALQEDFAAKIRALKEKEKDAQLKMFYSAFPTPVQP